MNLNQAKFYSKSFNSFSVARGKSTDTDRGTKTKKKKYSFGFSIVYRMSSKKHFFSLNNFNVYEDWILYSLSQVRI